MEKSVLFAALFGLIGIAGMIYLNIWSLTHKIRELRSEISMLRDQTDRMAQLVIRSGCGKPPEEMLREIVHEELKSKPLAECKSEQNQKNIK